MIVDFSGTTVTAITDTVLTGGGDENAVKFVNNEETPVMRHGVAKNGSCLVEVNDGGSNTKTLAELLALHSGVGEGDCTVSLSGVEYAYRSLVSVSMVGKLGQFVSISWKGAHG